MKTIAIRAAAVAAALLFTFQLTAQTYTTCARPNGLVYDGASNNHIWVACYGLQEAEELNATNGALVRTITGVSFPFGLAYDGANVWASEPYLNGGEVAKIQVSTGKVLGNYKVGAQPLGITFDGTYIWTANDKGTTSGNSVSKVVPATGVVTTYALTGCYAGGIAAVGSHLWVTCGQGSPNENTVMEMDKSGNTLATVTVQGWAWGPMTFDGTNLWVGTVTHLGSGTQGVSKINVTTLAVTNYPQNYYINAGLAFDGTNVWECGQDASSNGFVVQLKASTGVIVNTFPVQGGGDIQACVFGAGGLWESNYNASSVTKIP